MTRKYPGDFISQPGFCFPATRRKGIEMSHAKLDKRVQRATAVTTAATTAAAIAVALSMLAPNQARAVLRRAKARRAKSVKKVVKHA
jgi:hypothetical protein